MAKALVIVLLLASAVVGQTPVSSSLTVIKAGTLVDPETGAASTNQTIIVQDGKVSAVGANLTVPAGASIVDLSRYSVFPGLIDAHTHLCMDVDLQRDAATYFYTTLRDPDSFRAIQGVVFARSMLDSGFTTVRDVGNEGNYACSSVRRAIDSGLSVGPTMITAGRIIAPYGGQFTLQADKRGLAEPEYFFADTRDEIRKAIRENIHYGATVIKVVVDDQRYIYSEEDIRFIVAEAAAAGLKVAAHAWTGPGAHNAAAAGVTTIEHLNGISDEDLDIAKRNGVTAVFTPMPEAVLKQFRLEPGRAKSEFEQQINRLRSAHNKGVSIAFGTDAIFELPGLSRGETAMQWLDSYVTAGLGPKDILRAMTVNAARALGVENARGAIRPNLAADIVATAGNPLDDIQALKRVAFVMKAGRIVRQPR
jgi:imidazolonepropionase-like amidohydrolase